MAVWLALGGTGGLIAFVLAIAGAGRAVFRQISATEDNTKAMGDLTHSMDDLKNQLYRHETRLTVLEDRANRRDAQ